MVILFLLIGFVCLLAFAVLQSFAISGLQDRIQEARDAYDNAAIVINRQAEAIIELREKFESSKTE